MKYHHLTAEERFLIAALRSRGWTHPQIARELVRDRATIWRQTRRNCAPYGGGYRSARAHERAIAEGKCSRRNQQFGVKEFFQLDALLREEVEPGADQRAPAADRRAAD